MFIMIFLFMLVTYIIPVFNERKTVKKSIEDILDLKIEKEIIIIDNNSTDGSKEIIKNFENFKEVKIILKDKNLGFGHSIQVGFSAAKGKYIFIQYADLEYNHITSLEMVKRAEQNQIDVIFASRLKNFSKFEIFKSFLKKPSYSATLICTFLINIFYKKKLKDIIGTKLYLREKLINYIPNNNGQGFDFEFVSLICKHNLKIEEMHIEYTPRENSKDKKIKFYHMFNALYEIFKVKLFF